MTKIVPYDKVKDLVNHPEVYFVDVRTAKEIEDTGLIPGSKNIPIDEVDEAFALEDAPFTAKYGTSKPTKNSPIVFTCRSGKRAKMAMEILENAGYNNVKYYEGSWLEWASKNE